MTLSEYLHIPEYQFVLEFGGGYYHHYYNENVYLHFKTKEIHKNIQNLDRAQSLSKQLNIPIHIKTFNTLREPIINFHIIYNKLSIYTEKIVSVTETNKPTKYILYFPLRSIWELEELKPETHNVIYEI